MVIAGNTSPSVTKVSKPPQRWLPLDAQPVQGVHVVVGEEDFEIASRIYLGCDALRNLNLLLRKYDEIVPIAGGL